MNRFKYFAGLFFLVVGFAFCNKEDAPKIEIGLVINELMPANSNTIADQNGEFDDWIELFNNLSAEIDLSGYYLTDSKSDLLKWKFPLGTLIPAKSFLIVWADGDTLQTGLHTNYKLSSTGENVLLLTPELQVVDKISYDEQPIVVGEPLVEKSFARIPNGLGVFSWQIPTYNSENISN